MIKGIITFKAGRPDRNSFCLACKSVISFYHFELLYTNDGVGRTLVDTCSEECANLIILQGGVENNGYNFV